MKVIVFGAHGRVGQQICAKLKSAVTGVIRSDEQADSIKKLGANPKVLSVQEPVSTLVEAIKGHDAVIFTAGAGGKGGAERTVAIDLDGAAKTFEASELAGVKRYIMVSAFKAAEREYWYNGPLRTYYIAKHFADRELQRSKLDWTILQPAALLDGQGSGKVAPIASAESSDLPKQIFREDVASVVEASLKEPKTIGKVLPLINGDVAIADALAQ